MARIIPFTIEKNEYLTKDIKAFYRFDYYHIGDDRMPDYINILKNDKRNIPQSKLQQAKVDLSKNLILDIIDISSKCFDDKNKILICIVPRSKNINHYNDEELGFFYAVRDTAKKLARDDKFIDGSYCIVRHTDTKTTHLKKSSWANFGGAGDLPYKGISKDTCMFSPEVKGKNIILIDDLYTKTINIIEDMCQALFDKGAVNIVVYAIGRTLAPTDKLKSDNPFLRPRDINTRVSEYDCDVPF